MKKIIPILLFLMVPQLAFACVRGPGIDTMALSLYGIFSTPGVILLLLIFWRMWKKTIKFKRDLWLLVVTWIIFFLALSIAKFISSGMFCV